jgi:hypothetical protein
MDRQLLLSRSKNRWQQFIRRRLQLAAADTKN